MDPKIELYNLIHEDIGSGQTEDDKEKDQYQWVSIAVERVINNDWQNRTVIFNYDLPRWVYKNRKWVITWRTARIQCQYPRDYIGTKYCYYTPKKNEDVEFSHKLRAAKAQVTKWQNAITISKEIYKQELFPDAVENDVVFKKYESKLEMAKFKLEQLILSKDV